MFFKKKGEGKMDNLHDEKTSVLGRPVTSPPPPTPKYSIGEHIVFDRSKRDLHHSETVTVGRINSICLLCDEGCEWEEEYYLEGVDDSVLIEDILGPCTIGKNDNGESYL